ncbi:MAG: J domain-containing protein [Planctomycetota bacterium]|nr:J domain-containing protein [Planctomycetota bacterium]
METGRFETSTPDPFAVLGLPAEATAEEIRDAYFALVKAKPPERAPEQFKRIRKAYEAVRSPSGRLRSALLLFEAEKGGEVPPLPPPEPISRERVMEDLLAQEEIDLGLRDPGSSTA